MLSPRRKACAGYAFVASTGGLKGASGAPFAHHLVEEVLHDHEQKEYLALLTAGHSSQHLEQFGVDLFRESETVVRQVSH